MNDKSLLHDRRRWLRLGLLGGAALGLGVIAPRRALAQAAAATAGGGEQVTLELFDDSGRDLGRRPFAKPRLTEAQWHARLDPLDPQAYAVTREAGTERAYSGRYWNQHGKGLYRCIGCGTALFDAATKFESGTGWPSFWQPIAKLNISQSADSSLFMDRTAVSCKGCDAHLGHVFDDGPRPTGLRYCINSAALRFVPHAT